MLFDESDEFGAAFGEQAALAVVVAREAFRNGHFRDFLEPVLRHIIRPTNTQRVPESWRSRRRSSDITKNFTKIAPSGAWLLGVRQVAAAAPLKLRLQG